jgi:hypothetical protein
LQQCKSDANSGGDSESNGVDGAVLAMATVMAAVMVTAIAAVAVMVKAMGTIMAVTAQTTIN